MGVLDMTPDAALRPFLWDKVPFGLVDSMGAPGANLSAGDASTGRSTEHPILAPPGKP